MMNKHTSGTLRHSKRHRIQANRAWLRRHGEPSHGGAITLTFGSAAEAESAARRLGVQLTEDKFDTLVVPWSPWYR